MSQIAQRKKVYGIMAVTVAIILVGSIAFSTSLSVSSSPKSNSVSVTPAICQNSTVYKYQWMDKTSSTSPMSLSNASMACFTPNGQVVLFGGEMNVTNSTGVGKLQYSNETWMYNNQVWTESSGVSSIPGMIGSSMNYYPRGEDIVLFGGQNLTNSGKVIYQNQTWIFTGYTWTPLKELTQLPSARSFSASAYSASIGGVVMFGGISSTGVLNSTWEFKNNVWSKISTTGAIPSMEGSSMVSLSNGNLLLYGGYNNNSYSNQTWILNTTTLHWTLVNTPSSPGKLAFSSLEFFALNNLYLLYGGINSNGKPVNQTWKFNSSNWVNLNIASPVGEYGQGVEQLAANDTLVLFGGSFNNSANGFTNETFEFENNTYNWVKFTQSGLPPGMQWGMSINGMSENTTGNYTEFLLMGGTYTYGTYAPPGYSAVKGNVTMFASFVTLTISFNKAPTLFYYMYGLLAGIAIVIVAFIGSLVYRKVFIKK